METTSTQQRARIRIFQVIGILGAMGATLVVTSGDIAWPMMWAYLISYGVALFIVGSYLVRHDPGMMASRSSANKDAETWDRRLVPIILFLSSPVALIISGLDHRLDWSRPLPLGLQIGALVLGLLGYGLISWSMASNTHFEGLVRIQKDRDHTVQTGGPYAMVRHPGYVGMLVSFLAMPLTLGSLWALIPAGAGAVLLIVRTSLEDRTLKNKLDGYQAYAATVRYRLIPGVW